MATTITNQATLQFSYGAATGTASSNIASTVMQGPLTAAKSVLETAYAADASLTYIVNLTNSSGSALTNVEVTDDLGTYDLTPTGAATPLFYVDPAQLYINGAFSTVLTPAPGIRSMTFTIPSIPAGANAMLIYKMQVDSYAPLAVGSSITNTVTVTAPDLTEPLTASATIDVADYADVSITKTMSPNPVMDGETLTNTFLIQNYGNTAATNVVLTDTFSPVLDGIAVTVNGAPVAASNYDYVGGTLTLPNAAATVSLTVPAATFTTNPTTGEVTVSPGTTTIVVTGTV